MPDECASPAFVVRCSLELPATRTARRGPCELQCLVSMRDVCGSRRQERAAKGHNCCQITYNLQSRIQSRAKACTQGEPWAARVNSRLRAPNRDALEDRALTLHSDSHFVLTCCCPKWSTRDRRGIAPARAPSCHFAVLASAAAFLTTSTFLPARTSLEISAQIRSDLACFASLI